MTARFLQVRRNRLLIASLAVVAAATTSQVAAAQAPVVALAAAETGHELFKAEAHALYRSVDEGQHWQAVALPIAASKKAVASVAVAARGDQLLYVAGPSLGVWRSRDGGRTWSARNAGLPSTNVQSLTTHADHPDTVYVYVPKKGIFRSNDDGEHWRLMDAGPREPIVRFMHSNMPGSMQTGWLFAATAKGVSRSMDCFCGWRDAGALKTDVTAVAYDPSDPKRVYAITGEGLSVTDNGGERWSQGTSPAGDIAALVVGETGIVYATDGHGTLFRSSDHGRSWLTVDEYARGRAARDRPRTQCNRRTRSRRGRATTTYRGGAAIYERACASCHGAHAEGAPRWEEPDANGEMPPPPHDASGHTWKHSDAMLFRVVQQGRRDPFNKTQRLTMPAFQGQLSREQSIAVIDYLKTLWKPEQRQFQSEESRKEPFPANAE